MMVQLSAHLAEHPETSLEAVQVKSKFGSLCFYPNESDTIAERMIEAARKRAETTCEITGQPGHLCIGKTRRDPVMVLCPEKAVELGYSVFHQKLQYQLRQQQVLVATHLVAPMARMRGYKSPEASCHDQPRCTACD